MRASTTNDFLPTIRYCDAGFPSILLRLATGAARPVQPEARAISLSLVQWLAYRCAPSVFPHLAELVHLHEELTGANVRRADARARGVQVDPRDEYTETELHSVVRFSRAFCLITVSCATRAGSSVGVMNARPPQLVHGPLCFHINIFASSTQMTSTTETPDFYNYRTKFAIPFHSFSLQQGDDVSQPRTQSPTPRGWS